MVARAATVGFPLVIFESARRVEPTLQELVEVLGERRAVVMRELTKIHEETRGGALSELRHWTEEANPRGEIALVIAGAPETVANHDDAEAVVRSLRQSGLSASQAAREAASITGLPRSELYKLATAIEASGSIGLKGQLSLPDQDALQDPLGDQKGPKR